MPIAKGWSTVIGAYREDSWGADPVGPSCYQLNLQTVNFTANRNQIDDPTMSVDRGAVRSLPGNIDVGASLVVTANPGQIGFLLAMAFGLPTSSGSSAPYTHTFTPKALPSFQLEEDLRTDVTNTFYRYMGMRVVSGSLQINAEGPVVLTLNCSGKSISGHTTPLDATPSTVTHYPWGTQHAAIAIDGVSACNIRAFTLNWDNELDTGIYTLPCTGQTAGLRGELPEGRSVITGSADLMFSTTAAGLLTSALALGSVAITVTLTFGTGDGSAVGKEKLTLTLPKCDVGLFAPSVTSRSGISVTVPFTMYRESAAALTAVLLSPTNAAGLFISS